MTQFTTYDPKRYRILKLTLPNERPTYIVQKRVLWWWSDWLTRKITYWGLCPTDYTIHFTSFHEAKAALLTKINSQRKPKREVVLDRQNF